ncbi:hypothetical protein ABT346_30590 [Micromonospora peucetia]|uniref:hypothetical protein n=1 Tax=Micromonospora peucetia TaxID=47871 RepID=UPI0033224AE4
MSTDPFPTHRDQAHHDEKGSASPAKGTFVHPDAFDLLRGAVLQEPIADPELHGRVTGYLADQQGVTRRFHAARTADDHNAALNDLLRHADTHGQLIDDVIGYYGNYAKQPAHLIRDDDPRHLERRADRRTIKKTRRPRNPTT